MFVYLKTFLLIMRWLTMTKSCLKIMGKINCEPKLETFGQTFHWYYGVIKKTKFPT